MQQPPVTSFGYSSIQQSYLNCRIGTRLLVACTTRQTVTHYLLSDDAADGFLMFVYTNEPATDPDPGAKPYSDYARAIRAEAEKGGLSLRGGWLITDAGWPAQRLHRAAGGVLAEVRDSGERRMQLADNLAQRFAQTPEGRDGADAVLAADRDNGTPPETAVQGRRRSPRAVHAQRGISWEVDLG